MESFSMKKDPGGFEYFRLTSLRSESELKKFRQDQRQLIEMELKSGGMTDIDSEVVIVRLRLIAKYRNTLEEFNSVSLDEYQVIFASNLLLKDSYSQWLKLQQILIHIFWCSYIKWSGNILTLFIEAGRQGIITPRISSKTSTISRNAKHFSSSV